MIVENKASQRKVAAAEDNFRSRIDGQGNVRGAERTALLRRSARFACSCLCLFIEAYSYQKEAIHGHWVRKVTSTGTKSHIVRSILTGAYGSRNFAHAAISFCLLSKKFVRL